jgi:hypothetical protein
MIDLRSKTCDRAPPEMRRAWQMPKSVTTSRAIIPLLNPETLCFSIKTHTSRKRGAVTIPQHSSQVPSWRIRRIFLCGPEGRSVASPLSVYDFGPAKTALLGEHAQYRCEAHQITHNHTSVVLLADSSERH